MTRRVGVGEEKTRPLKGYFPRNKGPYERLGNEPVGPGTGENPAGAGRLSAKIFGFVQ